MTRTRNAMAIAAIETRLVNTTSSASEGDSGGRRSEHDEREPSRGSAGRDDDVLEEEPDPERDVHDARDEGGKCPIVYPSRGGRIHGTSGGNSAG